MRSCRTLPIKDVYTIIKNDFLTQSKKKNVSPYLIPSIQFRAMLLRPPIVIGAAKDVDKASFYISRTIA